MPEEANTTRRVAVGALGRASIESEVGCYVKGV
jgi:hypothetical protein